MTKDPEDLSVQEWLYQISYQLEQQTQLLRQALDVKQSDEQRYKCDLCDGTVKESKLEEHMRTDHGMPEGTSYQNRYEEI